MIKKAEQRGGLATSRAILEPTSGNTESAIAMIGAVKGYRVSLRMPECASTESTLILFAGQVRSRAR